MAHAGFCLSSYSFVVTIKIGSTDPTSCTLLTAIERAMSAGLGISHVRPIAMMLASVVLSCLSPDRWLLLASRNFREPVFPIPRDRSRSSQPLHGWLGLLVESWWEIVGFLPKQPKHWLEVSVSVYRRSKPRVPISYEIVVASCLTDSYTCRLFAPWLDQGVRQWLGLGMAGVARLCDPASLESDL
jgi:hypothetical protein